MAELISSNSTSSALHSSPKRKRTRDSNLVAATSVTATTPTYKATYQPITSTSPDYLNSLKTAAAALAMDELNTLVAMETSSTSAAVPLTQARNSIRNNSVNGSPTPSTTVTTTNGLTNGHTDAGITDNRTQYAVSIFVCRARYILTSKIIADNTLSSVFQTISQQEILSIIIIVRRNHSHGIPLNILHFH